MRLCMRAYAQAWQNTVYDYRNSHPRYSIHQLTFMYTLHFSIANVSGLQS